MKVLNKKPKHNMRHSNSWPERALTVKVRVDTVSRAYKILKEEPQQQQRTLTSENDIYKLGTFIVPKEINSQRIINKNKDEIECDIISRNHSEFHGIDQSSINPLNETINSIDFTNIHEHVKHENTEFRSDDELLIQPKPITLSIDEHSTAVHEYKNNIFDDNIVDNILVNVKIESINETSNKICSSPKENSGQPPVIRIVDYDDASTSKTWESRHACAKCKSDGFLELQVDPFRSSAEQSQNKRNCIESGTLKDRRFRSRSTTYDFRPGLGKTFGRRTKSFAGDLRGTEVNDPSPRPTIDHRKEVTLRRHYYPEGGYGYIVVACSALVHFLGIGLQLAAPGTFHISAELKFHHPPIHSAGKKKKAFIEITIVFLKIKNLLD